ncbi:hypothetical protein QE152_g11442 [Popillia japonica]|uniref:Uncharacterized protein n=1 Tax=Popillia japonica TaxID=7064 RepID=A0AAW1LRJ6_POPJA
MELPMRFWPSFLVLQLVLVADKIGSIQAQGIPSLSKCGKVHLTVSSLKDSFLEMNWLMTCDSSGEAPDIIALYNQDPRSATKPLHSVNAHRYEGYFKTPIKFRFPWLPGEWDYYDNITDVIPGAHCFPYWIASVRRNRIIDLNCLKVHPTWMDDNRSILGPQRIGSIFIPGTHNSGAYGPIPGIFKKYVLNQNMDIWTQLVFGIRYFDLRIGYYQGDGFTINHDLVKISKLEPHLRVIRRFLELAPKEIVILDLHRFPYPTDFQNSTHRKLIEILKRELGHFALPPSGLQVGKGPTLNEIWQHNKSLIICYGNRQMAKEYPWLWSPLQQHWGNKKYVSDLKDYLSASIENHNTMSNPLWALMAELTITPVEVIFNAGSNAKLADKVNRQLTKWFRDEWHRETNIVATDYFLGNDLINIAIEANKIR